MRYRKLDRNGDYSFGQGQGNFWINVPEAVAQSVYTRLMLWQGQWFYDTSQGTPWATEVLGERTQSTRDIVVQERVQDTVGVIDIAAYASVVNPNSRTFTSAMTIDTAFGAVTVTAPALPATIPPLPPAGAGAAPAWLLGLRGGPAPLTTTTMQRANLTLPGRQDITEFQIVQVDGARY